MAIYMNKAKGMSYVVYLHIIILLLTNNTLEFETLIYVIITVIQIIAY